MSEPRCFGLRPILLAATALATLALAPAARAEGQARRKACRTAPEGSGALNRLPHCALSLRRATVAASRPAHDV